MGVRANHPKIRQGGTLIFSHQLLENQPVQGNTLTLVSSLTTSGNAPMGRHPPCAWRREDVLITRERIRGRGHYKQTLLLLQKSLTQAQTLCFMQSSQVMVSLSENAICTTCFGHFLRSHVYGASLHTYVIKFYFLLFICLMSN